MVEGRVFFLTVTNCHPGCNSKYGVYWSDNLLSLPYPIYPYSIVLRMGNHQHRTIRTTAQSLQSQSPFFG